jgi:hypothetical protein
VLEIRANHVQEIGDANEGRLDVVVTGLFWQSPEATAKLEMGLDWLVGLADPFAPSSARSHIRTCG